MAVTKDRVYQLFPASEKGVFLTSDQTKILGYSIFAVIRITKPFPKILKIRAILQRQEIDVDLIYMPDFFYRAEVPNVGNFYFLVDNKDNIVSLDEEGKYVKLSTLTPVNTEQFENACRQHSFFFVG